ncbi:MAG: UPF0280 family protein [Chloroflexota bacterium]
MHCLWSVHQGLSSESHGGTPITTLCRPRIYRGWVRDSGLVSFSVALGESDLLIRARCDLRDRALEVVHRCRIALESYIHENPLFGASLVPIPVEEHAPSLVKEMASAASKTGVGPMAAVAGVIAEAVGRELLRFSDEVVVENGGDIFLKTTRRQLVGLYAGDSSLTGKIAFEVEPAETPLGVCTSSRSVGHSLSFGHADAVVAFSPSTPLADAAATAIANRVASVDAIANAIELAQDIPGLTGLVVVKDSNLGLWGRIRIARKTL